MMKQRRSMGVVDPNIDLSTKNLDKWRFMFHIFNLATLTVATISFGVSMTTFASAPPYPTNVKDYAVPMIYYGINGFAITAHSSFGALACVKGSLSFLKTYTVIGVLLFMEEAGFGPWIVSTLQSRIDSAIDEIRLLEDQHDDVTDHDDGEEEDRHDDDEEEDHEEEDHDDSKGDVHKLYAEINDYYMCCMSAADWMAENRTFSDIYTHCLTEEGYFCGAKYTFFPGMDANTDIVERCDCEGNVKTVITSRIVRQTSLMFIALPCQLLCLVCVVFFIKFEIAVQKNNLELELAAPCTE